jgi:methyl-accepting chemotaxis protein
MLSNVAQDVGHAEHQAPCVGDADRSVARRSVVIGDRRRLWQARATRDAVAAIQSIAGAIAEVNEIATSIASAVSEQGAATQEISRNIQRAAVGTAEIAAEISGVLQAADQSGTAASGVLGAANDLSRRSDALSGEVDKFLSSVRSA